MRASVRICSIPYGKTFVLAMALLAFFISAAEKAFRASPVQSALPQPSLGISHYFLDLKFSVLRAETQKSGPLDCVFLGTSQVDMAFDPEAFSLSYEKWTGKPIRSFNFGVAGLTLPSARALMHILVKAYRPECIMIGVMPAQFGEEIIRPSEERILSSPWIRYHTGDFNVNGWMIENSMAYRYFLRFRQWMEQADYSSLVSRREAVMSPCGFANFKNPNSTRSLVVDPRRSARFKRKLRNFRVSSGRIADFKAIMDYRRSVDMAVVEMPTHTVFKSFYGGGVKDHEETMKVIRTLTESRGLPFIPADDPGLYADELWLQSNHMNALGAERFSIWLGNKIGESVQKGFMKDPVTRLP